jgi:DNA-binding NarL/FixJ family response regulator
VRSQRTEAGLRLILDQCPDVHVVGEVQHADQAVPAAVTWRPAAMLVDADVAGQDLLPLIHDLHTCSPTSRILMLGDEATLERATLLKFGHWVAAYLMWADLRPETVPNCLALVLGNDLVIGSRAMLEEVLAPVECRNHRHRTEIVLRSRERAVLQRLACGLNAAGDCRCGVYERVVGETDGGHAAEEARGAHRLCAGDDGRAPGVRLRARGDPNGSST